MATVVVTPTALDNIERLIQTHSLPPDTRSRIKSSLRMLSQFPRLGAPLTGRWATFRFVLGPWRWMLIVYWYDEPTGRVFVVTIQDARTSSAATARRSD